MAGGVAKLAALCGVSHTAVCLWKRDNSIPGHRVGQIAEALGVSADKLTPLVRTWATRSPKSAA